MYKLLESTELACCRIEWPILNKFFDVGKVVLEGVRYVEVCANGILEIRNSINFKMVSSVIF